MIVPVLNEAKYLEATLQAIRTQNTNVPFEMIVCDNGSTDESIDIAKMYADRILSVDERGIGPTRHFGAMNADKNTKYFVFIDSDTIIPGYYLAYVYETFKTMPELIAFSTGFKFSERSKKIKFAERVANDYFLLRDKLNSVTLPGFNTIARSDAYFKCGGYRNVLLEDVDFSRRISMLGTARYFPQIKVVNSSRRLEATGLLGTLYYYSQLDLGWELNSTWVDNLTKKVGIADLRKYIGIR